VWSLIFHTTYRKPVLIVGNGARSAGISELIYEFIIKTHIPVLTTMNTVDMIQDEYRIGFIGTYGNRVANMILNECDVVISVGARLGLRQIGHKKELFAPKAKLIRCDVDQYELARIIKEDEEDYTMDAKAFMKQLLAEDIRDYTEWWNNCMEAKKLLDDYDDTDGNKLMKKISELLPKNPIVTVDIGQTVCWAAQSLSFKGTEGRIIIGGSYGAMGIGLPYAIGSSISMNNGITYCITGDGGLQMNIQELETVRREKLPIKILVVNNKELGKISEIQRGSYNDRYCITTAESGYTVPDFVKIANAYGIKAANVSNYERLDEYKNWMLDDEPCLLNIMLTSGTLLIPKIKWETCTIKPDLDEEMQKKINALINA
jgi:thiamine pyrophosphate-dependent acetolactate synthase large subunit-like protein